MLVPVTPLIDHTVAAIMLKGMTAHMLVRHIFKASLECLASCVFLVSFGSPQPCPTRSPWATWHPSRCSWRGRAWCTTRAPATSCSRQPASCFQCGLWGAAHPCEAHPPAAGGAPRSHWPQGPEDAGLHTADPVELSTVIFFFFGGRRRRNKQGTWRCMCSRIYNACEYVMYVL